MNTHITLNSRLAYDLVLYTQQKLVN